MVRQGVYDLKTGFLALNASEAHAVLDRIFTINLSCLVFTFGILLVAIQVAGGQYTPRIIATTLLRDNVIRCIVGLFVFTPLWASGKAARHLLHTEELGRFCAYHFQGDKAVRSRQHTDLQIARRLREMVESLTQSLPAHRHPPLLEELELLDRAMTRHYQFPEDLALARIPDSQGLGATSHKQSQE